MNNFAFLLQSGAAADFMPKNSWLGELVKWIFLAVLAAAVIVPVYLKFFYKGKDRTVEIVKRRRTVRDLFYPRLNAANKSSYIEMKNFTLDVKYKGRSRVHTLACSAEIYKSVREGRTYNVHIRIGEVTKILVD